ncbi:MAG: hypothetical protein NW220_09245 [Leptolyngbyaceae cyanobacterium bins.349]|nr:hypothetical protein [Leptolyngbyaceae cyanobacterium bins.349]
MKQCVPGWCSGLLPWLVAAGIHGLLLFVPLSPASNLAKSSSQGKVRLMNISEAPKTPPSAKPTPAIANPSTSSLVVAKRKPPVATQPKPRPASPPPPTQAAAQPPAKTATAARPTPTGPTPPKPKPTPKSAIAPDDLVVNLAQLPDTQPCQRVEGCWKSNKSQWRAVYAKVQQQFTAQGFTVTELELEDDTGFRVSQIAKSGATKYYLHLFSTLEGTVYILNPTQLSKDEVEQRLTPAG